MITVECWVPCDAARAYTVITAHDHGGAWGAMWRRRAYTVIYAHDHGGAWGAMWRCPAYTVITAHDHRGVWGAMSRCRAYTVTLGMITVVRAGGVIAARGLDPYHGDLDRLTHDPREPAIMNYGS